MKKSALRKLIRETIREQVGGTQGYCIDPCANNYDTPGKFLLCTTCRCHLLAHTDVSAKRYVYNMQYVKGVKKKM